ncbi:kinase-like protein [Saccharothrix syringae]|uniref:Kinase-like protein n=1 Tax=Saccharothrix syringae TaxID=103733 RepID=A0A5Q0H590_SACSY|nr:kinase-like protein [Saccharothrix syringae]QFZ21367.1 kinase-like protein [Saccharothrix syringae]
MLGRRAVLSGDVVRDEDVLDEIDRWSRSEPSLDAPPFLLSAEAYAALRALHGDDDRFTAGSTCHRAAVERHLAPVLRDIAEGRPASADELRMLAETTRVDPVQAAFGADPSPDVVLERLRLLASVWTPFSRWWRDYFADTSDAPVVDLWQLYLPFARWIVREKRSRRPDGLFVMGFNGSPGAGKTVLTTALTVVVDQLLDVATEGRAIARSGDDWYLGRADREPLRALGYDPGVPGVTNRSLPGTHDLDWLLRNLAELERSTPGSVVRMGNFDKRIDDQPTGDDRFFEVRGKVGVLLFDLWFAGARTDVDPMVVPDGLGRRVAEHLRRWRPVFERLDGLWAFDWPSFERMTREREAQERLVEQRRGTRGMSREGVRAFMSYMVERSWDWRTTSPVPPEQAVTFRAWRDTNHRVIAVQRGGRAT